MVCLEKPSGVVMMASWIGKPEAQFVIVPLIVPRGAVTQAGFTLKLKIRVFQSKLAVGKSTYSNPPQNVQSSAGSVNREL